MSQSSQCLGSVAPLAMFSLAIPTWPSCRWIFKLSDSPEVIVINNQTISDRYYPSLCYFHLDGADKHVKKGGKVNIVITLREFRICLVFIGWIAFVHDRHWDRSHF